MSIRKLEHLAIDNDTSVKQYLESVLVDHSENNQNPWPTHRLANLNPEQKEDLGPVSINARSRE